MSEAGLCPPSGLDAGRITYASNRIYYLEMQHSKLKKETSSIKK